MPDIPGGEKWIEEPRQKIGRDPRSVVADLDDQDLARSVRGANALSGYGARGKTKIMTWHYARADLDVDVRPSGIEGVLEEVYEQLL